MLPWTGSNADLVRMLAARGSIKSEAVARVMLQVDRINYAPAFPYIDRPLKIGLGASTVGEHTSQESRQTFRRAALQRRC